MVNVVCWGLTAACTAARIADATGGALGITVPADWQQEINTGAGCTSPPVPWVYAHSSYITITGSTFLNNSVVGGPGVQTLASGGGLGVGSGGSLTLVDTLFRDNSASQFGGGLVVGGGAGQSTCEVHLLNVTFEGNTAGHGGSAAYLGCGGDIEVVDSAFSLNGNGSQVPFACVGCGGVRVCGKGGA